MTEWNAKTEQLVRDLGDYIDEQMRDILDPKASTLGTATRIAFRHASRGTKLMERARDELGCTKERWNDDLERVIALAEANGSDAAAKLKKALPFARQLSAEFNVGGDNIEAGKLEQMKRLKQVKKKGLKYD